MSPTTEMACTMPAKILFVDDEPDLESLICQKFRKKIRTGEYQVFFCTQWRRSAFKVARAAGYRYCTDRH